MEEIIKNPSEGAQENKVLSGLELATESIKLKNLQEEVSALSKKIFDSAPAAIVYTDNNAELGELPAGVFFLDEHVTEIHGERIVTYVCESEETMEAFIASIAANTTIEKFVLGKKVN